MGFEIATPNPDPGLRKGRAEKTSVRYTLRDCAGILDDPQRRRDFCASVRAAIVEVLVKKTVRAAQRTGRRCVTASGGVTCNRALRRMLAEACGREGLRLRLAQPEFSTDNAAMVAALGEHRLSSSPCRAGAFGLESDPAWALDDVRG